MVSPEFTEELYGEFMGDEHEISESVITCCTLPLHDREEALKDLRQINICHDSLFPDDKEVAEMKRAFQFVTASVVQ